MESVKCPYHKAFAVHRLFPLIATSPSALARCVRVALGDAFSLTCPAANRDQDLRVTVDELIGVKSTALIEDGA